MIIVPVLKWVAEAIVCVVEALCRALVVLAALLMVAAIPVSSLGATVPPLIAPASVTAILLAATRLMGEVNRCRLLGIIGWPLMWATLGAGAMAVVFGAIGTAMVMAVYGAMVAGLIWAMQAGSCRLPRLWSWP